MKMKNLRQLTSLNDKTNFDRNPDDPTFLLNSIFLLIRIF